MRKNVLDAAEGVGEGYADHTVEVITPDGARISARTCVGTTLGPGLKHTAGTRHSRSAVRASGLPAGYIDQLEHVEAIADADTGRRIANEQILVRGSRSA